jgi:chromatin segregation and condensation protein Rec8/ScpA/Scc1 (kleisin family)
MEDHDIEMMAEQPWEETLEVLTRDMDPQDIDISVLADRYREYINELQEYDLAVPARAIRLCAALLKMKAVRLYYEEEQEEKDENPMDFEEEEIEEVETQDREPDLEFGPELDMPVKPKPKRRVTMDELKESLEDALEIKEKREERQERRMEIDEQFDMDEEDLTQKLNSLFSRIKGMVSSKTREEVDFDHLVESDDNEERIEKFKHILSLENDEKVDVIQEEFLGSLKVRPDEDAEAVN